MRALIHTYTRTHARTHVHCIGFWTCTGIGGAETLSKRSASQRSKHVTKRVHVNYNLKNRIDRLAHTRYFEAAKCMCVYVCRNRALGLVEPMPRYFTSGFIRCVVFYDAWH